MILAPRDICTGCSACSSVCPEKAIAMAPDAEGFLQPRIDRSKCVGCGLCRKVCPVLTTPLKNHGSPECFAFKTRDRELLRTSSSGGAFSELALPVIRSGGVVFGCVMTKPDFVAHHVMAESELALAAMRGSKYVQSEIGNAFVKCKEVLLQGRKVLFCGTSCQIAGLKAYLGKEYTNLTTVDFICHGVPSPAVWNHYKTQCERCTKSLLSNVSFRDKYYSWERFSLSLSYNNKLDSINPCEKDLYFKAFLGNFCLRLSCYTCLFKQGRGTLSDITISDFWGIKEMVPWFYDKNGVSAIIIHTQKGKTALDNVKRPFDITPVLLDDIVRHNPSYFKAVALPRGRTLFMRLFRLVNDYGFLLKLARHYPFLGCVKTIISRFYRLLWAV